MKTYAVRKGKHDFSPPEFPTPIRYGRCSLHWTFTLEANCWYDTLGTDNADWNKLGGITRFFSPNNVDSLLIAWRPLATEPGYFQICIYENIGDKIVPQEDDFRVVQAGETFSVEFQPDINGQFHIYYGRRDITTAYWTHSNFRQMFTQFRRIGLWFGGNQPAPQQMYIRANFKMERA